MTSLRDEIKPRMDQFSLKIKRGESLSIAKQIAEFENRGGVITVAKQGASGLQDGFLFIPECKGSVPLDCNTAAMKAKGKKGAAANALKTFNQIAAKAVRF